MTFPLAGAIGLAMAALTQPAVAASVFGHDALALGALVGSCSTALSNRDRLALARLLDGHTAGTASTATVVVTADAVVCHAGNVDIAAFGCELTFGGRTVALTGRRAHELFATISEAGVPREGAAGTVYAALHAMSCTIDTVAIARKDGSGATCRFVPDPP